MNKRYSIVEYQFDDQLELTLLDREKDFLTWPIVYFLQNKKIREAYVGETTDMVSRMKTHLNTPRKKNLNTVSLIRSELFNKSATLDIEANLIRYIAADGEYTLQNGNLGISNHSFYQKRDVYWNLFKDIWQELMGMGIARHSLQHIDNSDLFKYSPYKCLSREQTRSLKLILECLLDPNAKVSLIHGGAGTGKSILAIFLFKLLKTDLSDFNRAEFEEEDEELFRLVDEVRRQYRDLEMGLVIPMQSFRKTISKVFRNIKGLSQIMVMGPADVVKKKYDLLIVDEGHRLRQRKNLAAYYGTFDKACQTLGLDKNTCSEVDWILHQSDKSVFFYDEFQTVKPSDVDKKVFIDLQSQPSTRIERLRTQVRVKGGEDYVEYIHQLFSDKNQLKKTPFRSFGYDFRIFSDLRQMVDKIKTKNGEFGLCRLVAGFAWEWVSKNDKDKKDIVIGDVELKWNSTDVDWVNSGNAINEVGCIHTTQGYDLNYTGVIIGPELDYDFTTHSFVVYRDRYKDKNGKNSIDDENVVKNYILNIYRTILFRGIRGTFVYACNENLREYLNQYIAVEGGIADSAKVVIFDEPGPKRIPLYDLKISAGDFSSVQSPDSVRYVELDEDYAQLDRYFACEVVGESMNRIIPSGSICLFEKYQGGSRNGLICLVELKDFVDLDFGAHYTIKEYSSKKTVSEDGWQHQEIVLLPNSTDESYKPIVLRDEETSELKVVGVYQKVLQKGGK